MDAHGKYTEVLIRWNQRIEAGEPPLVLGDGQQTMDFVHVEDIARANILAVKAEVTDSVYNIATATETSLLELAEALQKVMGSTASLEFGPARSVNSVTRRLADIGAAERELGWKPTITLEDGLASLVSWWRAHK
jgi:UDP-glucose 4-epimerase